MCNASLPPYPGTTRDALVCGGAWPRHQGVATSRAVVVTGDVLGAELQRLLANLVRSALIWRQSQGCAALSAHREYSPRRWYKGSSQQQRKHVKLAPNTSEKRAPKQALPCSATEQRQRTREAARALPRVALTLALLRSAGLEVKPGRAPTAG